jgi:uncharacterized protein YggE
MKLATTLLASLVTFAGSFSLSAEIEDPHILVIATATRTVEPDVLTASFQLKTIDDDFDAALERNRKAALAVHDWFRALGVPVEDIRQSDVQMGANYSYGRDGRQRDGFFAQSGFQVEVDDVTKRDEVLRYLATHEDIESFSDRLEAKDAETVRGELRLEALRKAKAKAKEMAGSLGVEIGMPLLIQETGGVRPMDARAFSVAEESTESGVVSVPPGSIGLSAQVSVAFELEEIDDSDEDNGEEMSCANPDCDCGPECGCGDACEC